MADTVAREARRLGVLFAIVYFAQGMVYLPDQVVAIVFKERGLTAGQLAAFTWITTVPWFVKPLYGLLSDFVPLGGTRRRGYFLLMAGLAFVLLTRCLVTIHGEDSEIAHRLRGDRKGKISVLIYAMAIPLAFVQWWLAFALYIVVAAIWFVPDRRIELPADG